MKRTQNFTNSDASEGDVLMIETSLGYPAQYLTVEADNTFQFRINVYNTIYPPRGPGDGLPETYGMPNLARGVTYQSSGMALITVEPGTVYTLEKELPISDIELVTASGVAFDIYVS